MALGGDLAGFGHFGHFGGGEFYANSPWRPIRTFIRKFRFIHFVRIRSGLIRRLSLCLPSASTGRLRNWTVPLKGALPLASRSPTSPHRPSKHWPISQKCPPTD